MKRKSGKLGYYLILALTRPIAWLPLKVHRFNARWMAFLVGKVFKYRRDVVMTNLSRSFPDKKYDELEEICDKTYQYFCRLFCEAFWYGTPLHTKALVESHIVKVTNPELVNDLYDKGKSIMVMLSHSGNFEILGSLLHYMPCKFDIRGYAVVYKALTSPAWNSFMKRNRIAPIPERKIIDGMVESFDVMRFIFNNMNKFRMYMFISDQSPYSDTSKVKVDDFMHQTTYSMDGAPAIANHFGWPVLYASMRIREDGYDLTFKKICDDASEMDRVDILNSYYKLIEEDLNNQPWNYLWTHKRWKM